MNRRTFIISTAAASLAPLSKLIAATASEASSSATGKTKRPRTNPKGFMLAMLNSDTSRALS